MDDLDLIYEFLMKCDSSSYHWRDLDGHKHTANMSYVMEFIIDLRNYIYNIGGMEIFKQKWNAYKELKYGIHE